MQTDVKHPPVEWFVNKDSIVRKIWGKADTILFIFGGAAAEFAVNKAVDWLYFTGRLPADPIGRLFSTVTYARQIVFSKKETAHAVIDKMRMIHSAVEQNRGYQIPDWAYRDVLFMLIHYSLEAYELLYRKLSEAEKEDVFDVFYRVGDRMGLTGLPSNYQDWLAMYDEHLANDIIKSQYTDDLYKQYEKHLGSFRLRILKEAQVLVIPSQVNALLNLGKFSLLTPILPLYKLSRKAKLDWWLTSILLPRDYKKQIKQLNVGA
ncbi:MAG TPA: oxygenase MpaB family protein [Chryseosolibacter sp.]|nr:oxygenase MpaB family protein [Chryseosolibacter sp.]